MIIRIIIFYNQNNNKNYRIYKANFSASKYLETVLPADFLHKVASLL